MRHLTPDELVDSVDAGEAAPAAFRSHLEICEACRAQRDAMIAVLTDAREGLFPEPRELALDCSCPDSAEVCKHVAAVLYGIAVRLDARPELFFDLRQVDQAELISSATAGAGIVRSPSAAGKRIAADRLSSVFGIDLETAPSATRRPRRRAAPARKSP